MNHGCSQEVIASRIEEWQEDWSRLTQALNFRPENRWQETQHRKDRRSASRIIRAQTRFVQEDIGGEEVDPLEAGQDYSKDRTQKSLAWRTENLCTETIYYESRSRGWSCSKTRDDPGEVNR